MIWAVDQSGRRIAPSPMGRATCPGCRASVIAKCGRIVAHHWAHEASADCDPWHEPETVWHQHWKSRFPADWQEVVMGSHRADVRTPRGLAIEFQNSPLDPGQIVERERFYGRLLWVLNAKLFLKHFHLRPGGKWEIDDDEYTGTYYTFRWRWPRKSVWFMRKPVYFDLGDGRLFRLRTVHPNVPCGGWGVMGTTRQFVNRIIESAIGDRGGANG